MKNVEKETVAVKSRALQRSILIQRNVGQIIGDKSGPTLIIVSGIHGNEPSGLFAVTRVLEKLSPKELAGNVFALAGNMEALSLGQRYITHDLNRLWTEKHLSIETSEDNSPDIKEQRQLLASVEKIIKENSGPFYIIDLHTTSSKTIPFLTINNHDSSLAFCKPLPVPKVTGIDDFVKGAFFTHMNKEGYIALGFEAGSHDALEAIEHHEAFIRLVLDHAGITKVDKDSVKPQLGSSSVPDYAFYEINERFQIDDNLPFQMNSGYVNFQDIERGEVLAQYDGQEVNASRSGKIFLPLYQKQGNDGFFIINRIDK